MMVAVFCFVRARAFEISSDKSSVLHSVLQPLFGDSATNWRKNHQFVSDKHDFQSKNKWKIGSKWYNYIKFSAEKKSVEKISKKEIYREMLVDQNFSEMIPLCNMI